MFVSQGILIFLVEEKAYLIHSLRQISLELMTHEMHLLLDRSGVWPLENGSYFKCTANGGHENVLCL